MADGTTAAVQVDGAMKEQCEEMFEALGLDLTTAFNLFMKRSLYEGGLPFAVRFDRPNKETLAAMLEAERIAKDTSVKGYTDVDELFADLES